MTLVELGGPPKAAVAVVFLHGFMGCAEDWREIAAGETGIARCVGLTLPGHGSEPWERAGGGFAEAVEGIPWAALLHSAGLPPKRVLAGYSMGGRIALYLASRHPELFSAALVESATPGLTDEAARTARVTHDQALAKELAAITDSGEFRAFLAGWYSRPPFETLNETQRAWLVERRLGNDPAQLAQALTGFSLGTQPDLWPALEGVQIPVLGVCGEKDHKFRRIMEDMALRSEHVAVQVVGNAGHNVHFEQPGAYTTVLRGLIDSVLAVE